jgi:hypothetical protein
LNSGQFGAMKSIFRPMPTAFYESEFSRGQIMK